jgi:hypothetical protein
VARADRDREWRRQTIVVERPYPIRPRSAQTVTDYLFVSITARNLDPCRSGHLPYPYGRGVPKPLGIPRPSTTLEDQIARLARQEKV